MKAPLTLVIVLAGTWILLSGHWSFFLLSLGVASVAVTVLCGVRLKIVDKESVPVHLLPGLIRYTPWLIGQIIQSSLHVARRVLSPKLPISPTIIHIDTQQTDALNSVSYANSITLTPGTISLDVGKDQIEVHALTSESAESLKSGLMAKKVRKMEGVR